MYRQVRQVASDDSLSDEEDVIFRQPGDLELQLVPSDTSHHRPRRKRRPKQDIIINKNQYRVTVALGLLLVMVTGLVIGLVVVKHLYGKPIEVHAGNNSMSVIDTSNATHGGAKSDNSSHSSGDVGQFSQMLNWSFSMEDFATESCIRLLDVDGDGREDVLFGAVNASLMKRALKLDGNNMTFSSLANFCHTEGLDYPCLGLVVAVRGYDGKLLYRLPVRSEVLLLNCDSIDLNNDGRPDCIGTGRHAVAVAFDPYEGRVLWSAEDDRYLVSSWNVYQAMALPDWDQDGVPELLLANGGNPEAEPEDHDREAGRLVILSGATGRVLGDTYLPMPHSKETYMTPVLYQAPGGSTYILFGSGGETVAGDFMAISLVDFCHHILGAQAASICPGRDTAVPWPSMQAQVDDTGIFVIYRGESKGVMVPPVIVDVDSDGADDILMSAYEGKVILYDGRTLDPVWTAYFPGMESYSTPAPGYFDDDNVLDFMVHWCVGAWPLYTGSNVTILSGKDGRVLWTLETASCQMTSDLAVHTADLHRDMFLYRVKGRESRFRLNANGTITRLDDTNMERQRRHGGDETAPKHDLVPLVNGSLELTLRLDFQQYHVVCDDDLSTYQDEVFLMDHGSQLHPYRVMTLPSTRYYYNVSKLSDEDSGEVPMATPAHHVGHTETASIPPTQGQGGAGQAWQQQCSVMSANDRSTGAIGDVDGDGSLDYISLRVSQAALFDAGYSYWKSKYVVTVDKVNLWSADPQEQLRPLAVQAFSSGNNEHTNTAQSGGYAGPMLPLDRQQWTQYMGRHGNSIYKKGL